MYIFGMSVLQQRWTCLWLGVILVPPAQVLNLEENANFIAELTSPVLHEKYYWNESSQLSNDSSIEAIEIEYLEEALEEQDYYLQRLFLHYGDNGTLSFGGLQRLLGSLGLGKVSVLEISHRGLKQSSSTSTNSYPPAMEPTTPSSRATHWDSFPSEIQQKELEDSPDVLHSGRIWGTDNEGKVDSRFPWKIHPSQEHPQSGTPAFLLNHHPTKNHLHENCLNVTQLLWNFGLGKASHITPSHFTFLCPALLYQIDSRVCLRHSEESALKAQSHVAFLKALGWGSLALTVISLPSILALGVIPLLPPAFLQKLLCPMAALAVGTLCGDALLHLLPHGNLGSHSASEQKDAILKGLCVLAGLYLLFLVESMMGLQHHHKKVKMQKRGASEQDVKLGGELTVLQTLHGEDCAEEGCSPDSLSKESPRKGRGHSHGHGYPAGEQPERGTLVWMVIMGDGIHNLTDGLALGAAFSQSLAGGLSTMVAVFCHELPHELGDLAVLLAAGWPVRRLLLFSALSAVFGFFGLLAGTFLSHYSEQLSPWVLAITAGVFLHVALADMMPEMLHGDSGSIAPMSRFFLQNVGLLAGVGIMLCIALFEENITFSLGDS